MVFNPLLSRVLRWTQAGTVMLLLLGLLGSMLFPSSGFALSRSKKAIVRIHVEEALNELRHDVHGANQVLNKARGVLVFPHVYQAGFILGGEFGRGALLENAKTTGYYRLISGSAGWQIGGQRKSLIIAFMTNESLNRFKQSEGWDVGADASVALFAEGLEERVSATHLEQPILVFVVDQRGLMAGASLKGLKISRLD